MLKVYIKGAGSIYIREVFHRSKNRIYEVRKEVFNKSLHRVLKLEDIWVQIQGLLKGYQ